jgi:bifunctional non-homologous end joining protein LigD
MDAARTRADGTPELAALVGVVDVPAAYGELDLEGIVAKRVDSRYRPGERSPDWIRLKTADWKSLHAARRHEH